MASRKKEDLHPVLVAAFEEAVIRYAQNYPDAPKPFLTCTYRSGTEQDQLFKQVPKVTNARAGQSPHNYMPSFAFDVAFMRPNKSLDWSIPQFRNFALILSSIDPVIEWGGSWTRFKDNPHFQLRNWKPQIKKGG